MEQQFKKKSSLRVINNKSTNQCHCDYCGRNNTNKKSSKWRSRSLDSLRVVREIGVGSAEERKKAGASSTMDVVVVGAAIVHHYYSAWQGEKFRASALERENERLEARVKCLEAKLEREILQQIKISFEWRKAVVSLVDENTRLKKLFMSSSSSSSSS